MLPKVIGAPILHPQVFLNLREELEECERQFVDLGDIPICLAEVQDFYIEDLMHEIEFELNQAVDPIAVFARYNSPDVDTSFRIHSDGRIQGQQPDVAFVYYIKGKSGTALFDHPEHGRSSEKGEVFTDDDGFWQETFYHAPKPNTILLYDAKSFHSRWPNKEEEDRIVIVGFLKLTGEKR